MSYVRSVIRTSRKRCNHFIVRPLRHDRNVAINGTLHEILLSGLRNITVATIQVTKTARRFSAVANIQRSILSILLGVGRVVLHDRADRPRVNHLLIRKPTHMATRRFSLPSRIRIIGHRRCVTAITSNCALRVRFQVRQKRNCQTISHDGSSTATLSFVRVSSIFVPIHGIGCAISRIIISNSVRGSRLAVSV